MQMRCVQLESSKSLTTKTGIKRDYPCSGLKFVRNAIKPVERHGPRIRSLAHLSTARPYPNFTRSNGEVKRDCHFDPWSSFRLTGRKINRKLTASSQDPYVLAWSLLPERELWRFSVKIIGSRIKKRKVVFPAFPLRTR